MASESEKRAAGDEGGVVVRLPGIEPSSPETPVLPGRERFEAQVRGAARRRRTGDNPWVGMASIEGLALVSARAGRRTANELARGAAARLRGCLREGDVLAALGDGRFGLIVNAPYGDEAMAAFERLVRSVGELVAADARFSGARLTVGVAQLWTDDPAVAIGRADRALERARARGGPGLTMSTELR